MKTNSDVVKKEGFGANCWIIGHRCYRCGHKWVPRENGYEPRVCPNSECKSPYWKTPKKIFKKGEKKNGK